MKKKILIIGGVLALVIIGVLVILFLNRTKYTIKVSMVDSKSPDRVLTVYNDKNEEISVKRIERLDGAILCYGYNTAVYFGEIKDKKELVVVLKDNTKVKAKIVEEEVK